jgi:outer membrane protein
MLALMLACALAFALPVRADTLEQALAQAYQNNPTLNSQRAVVRATDETVPQALSGYKPTVRVPARSRKNTPALSRRAQARKASRS